MPTIGKGSMPKIDISSLGKGKVMPNITVSFFWGEGGEGMAGLAGEEAAVRRSPARGLSRPAAPSPRCRTLPLSLFSPPQMPTIPKISIPTIGKGH